MKVREKLRSILMAVKATLVGLEMFILILTCGDQQNEDHGVDE